MRMWRTAVLGAVLWAGVAWGQGVVVRPPEAAADAKPELVLQSGEELLNGGKFSFSDDRSLLLVSGGRYSTSVYDVVHGVLRRSLPAGHAVMLPRSHRCALWFAPDNVRVIDCDTGAEEVVMDHLGPIKYPAVPVLSGDGSTAAWAVYGRGSAMIGWADLASRLVHEVKVKLPASTAAEQPNGGGAPTGPAVMRPNLALSERGTTAAVFYTFYSFGQDSGPRGLLVVDLATGRVKAQLPFAGGPDLGRANAMFLGEDSLLFESPGGFGVWDLRSPTATRMPALNSVLPLRLSDVAWASEARMLAVQRSPSRIELFRPPGATPSSALEIPGGASQVPGDYYQGLALSRDGRAVAVREPYVDIQVLDTASGALQHHFRGRQDWLYHVAAEPGGRRFATARRDNVMIWSVDDQGPPRRCRFSGDVFRGDVEALAWSTQDGLQAICALKDGGFGIWRPEAVAEVRRLDDSPALAGQRNVNRCLSPDGRWIAMSSSESDGRPKDVDVWDLSTGRRIGSVRVGGWALAAFSPDGARLAIAARGTDKRTLVGLWDPATLEPAGSWVVPLDRSLARVAWSPDGKRIVCGSPPSVSCLDPATGQWGDPTGADLAVAGEPPPTLLSPTECVVLDQGRAKLCTYPERRELASFLTFDGGGKWLTVTPEGYYDCSLEAAPLFTWSIGDQIYPFDQLEARFHRPDLVRRALAGGSIADEPAFGAASLPPNCAITSPAYGAEVSGDSVDVTIKAAGQRPILRIDLSVGGSPVPPELAAQLRPEHATDTERTFRLTVPFGPTSAKIRLRAVAYDTAMLRSAVSEVTIFRPGVKQWTGDLHVLAVGVNQYPRLGAKYQLKYAAPDAEAVVEMLQRLGNAKPYQRVQATVLLDDAATASGIRLALRRLKDSATEYDTAVVYVAGHGFQDAQRDYWFCGHDVDEARPTATAIAWSEFQDTLRELRAKQVLLLADTCHSEGLVGARVSFDELAIRVNREARRMVFTAARADEASLGLAKFGHGAFTQALLEALVGTADLNRDGDITYAELRDFVVRRVVELTDDRQHPQLPFLERDFEPDAVFARAYYANQR